MVVPSLKAGMLQTGNPEQRGREVYPGCLASSITTCSVFTNPSGTVSSAAQALSKPTPNTVSVHLSLSFSLTSKEGKERGKRKEFSH